MHRFRHQPPRQTHRPTRVSPRLGGLSGGRAPGARGRWPGGVVSLLLVLAAAGSAGWRDVPAPPRQHAERLIFDEEQGRWIRVVDPVPGTEDGDLDIARQWIAREDYQTGLRILARWLKTYGPEAPRYPEALYLEARCHLGLNDYRAAHRSFQRLLNEYPGSPFAEQSLSGAFRVAEQYLAGKRRKAWGGLLRLRDRDKGVEIMDDILINYADTPLAELAQKAKADFYYERGEFEMAEEEYAIFAREFPRSRYHPYALMQSAQAAWANFPGVQFDDRSLIEAEERFRQFRTLYPDQAVQLDVPVMLDQIAASRAEKTYEIGWFYDRTGEKNAARFYYRATINRWPDTPAAAQARARLAAIGAPPPPEDDDADLAAYQNQEPPGDQR